MADFTALKTAITNAIKQNGNQDITGNLLQEILIAMVEGLGDTALNNLATSIQVSLNSLSAVDGNLANALSSEVSTRQSADNSLASAINSEALARSQADTTLQQNINTESNQRQSTDNSLQNQITIEKNARIDAVNRLQGLIDAINNVVGNGYTFGGVVKINDAPQQGKMFYIALERGNYINFGGASVHNGITLIYNNGQWIAKELLDLDVFYGEILRIVNAYQPIVIEGNVTNAPDEEDLTSNNIGLLQFKNKAYAPTIYSGLGRKYLRKNIRPRTDSASFDGFVENVESEASLSGTPDAIFWDRINERFVGKKDDVYYQDWTDSDDYVPVSSELVYMNEGTPYRWDGNDLIVYDEIYPDLINMLTQEMISDANTIYHIQYDYTLGEDITVPENCVLEFDGGSLSNGTLVGQNTEIKADIINIFDNISISGTWRVLNIYSTWFSNITEENQIRNLYALSSDDFYNVIHIYNGTYIVSVSSNGEAGFILKSNTKCILEGSIEMKTNVFDSYQVILIEGKENITISGNGLIKGEWDGVYSDNWFDTMTHEEKIARSYGHGLYIGGGSKNIRVSGIKISNCQGDAIYVGGIGGNVCANENIIIEDCDISYCRRQGISVTWADGYIIKRNRINHIATGDPSRCIFIEPNHHQDFDEYNYNGEIANNYIEDTDFGIQVVSDNYSSLKIRFINIHDNFIICNRESVKIDKGDYVSIYCNKILRGDLIAKYASIFDNEIRTKLSIDALECYNNLIKYYPSEIDLTPISVRRASFIGNDVINESPNRYYAFLTVYVENNYIARNNFTGNARMFLYVGGNGSDGNVIDNYYDPSLGVGNKGTSPIKISAPIHVSNYTERPFVNAAYPGFCIFDTALGKPIWYNGTNWVDATGATV